MKNKHWFIVVGIFLALLTISHIFFQIRIARIDRQAADNIKALTDTVTQYKTKIKGLETIVFEKNALIMDKNNAIRANLIEKEELRKLHFKSLSEVTRLTSYIRLLRDSVNTDAVIVYVDSSKTLKLPFNFSDKNEYLDLKGSFDYNGTMRYSLEMPVKLNIYVGISKDKSYKSVVTTTNPYVKIEDIVTVKMDTQRKKNFGLGVFGGFGITTTGLQPMIGVGVTYSVIKF